MTVRTRVAYLIVKYRDDEGNLKERKFSTRLGAIDFVKGWNLIDYQLTTHLIRADRLFDNETEAI